MPHVGGDEPYRVYSFPAERCMPHMCGDEPDRLCPMCNWRRVCPTDVGRYKNEGDDVNMKNLQELPKLKDSISYLYIEHAIIEQNDTAIVAIKKEGKIPIPIAAMTCLLLGPGTRVTHAAIRALCDNGAWRSGAERMRLGFMRLVLEKREAQEICSSKPGLAWIRISTWKWRNGCIKSGFPK